MLLRAASIWARSVTSAAYRVGRVGGLQVQDGHPVSVGAEAFGDRLPIPDPPPVTTATFCALLSSVINSSLETVLGLGLFQGCAQAEHAASRIGEVLAQVVAVAVDEPGLEARRCRQGDGGRIRPATAPVHRVQQAICRSIRSSHSRLARSISATDGSAASTETNAVVDGEPGESTDQVLGPGVRGALRSAVATMSRSSFDDRPHHRVNSCSRVGSGGRWPPWVNPSSSAIICSDVPAKVCLAQVDHPASMRRAGVARRFTAEAVNPASFPSALAIIAVGSIRS